MSNITFALDIGTRSVTGVLIEKDMSKIRLIDYCIIEHDERSMRDGQIHDVVAVANTIKEVKSRLEAKIGTTLHKVCIAAAGRALKTIEARASVNLLEYSIQTNEDVKHLELSALQVAQEKLKSDEMNDGSNHYHCVGYSLLYYQLDNERIDSLIEQKGNEASADIIATFLPKVVVESLLTAVTKADLEVEAMTLEPIAALNVLIPESMRRLNVVLIDIGAGTSDIAITDKGTVVSYGMVPVAGDEITEAISDSYLLDFPVAEKVKREIVMEKTAEIEDILGFSTTITYEELIIEIEQQVDHLARTIAGEIKKLNIKSPRAVMLVGGGSLTPNISDKLSGELDLPLNRIAIRGVDAIQQLEASDNLPAGPTFVTPIGIAITAKERPVHYISVIVNGEDVRLFEVNELTVGDCLVQAGYELRRFYGKPGLAVIITLNGKEIPISGEYGKPPVIYLNHAPATVHDQVKHGDTIKIERGHDGENAEMSLAELVGREEMFQVQYNGMLYDMGTSFLVNGTMQPSTYRVKDRDNIRWRQEISIKDFLTKYFPNQNVEPSFPIIIDQREINLPMSGTSFLVNNKKANVDTTLQHGDEIKIIPSITPTVEDVVNMLGKPYWQEIEVTFNEEKITLKKPAYQILRKQDVLKYDSNLYPNDRLTMKNINNQTFLFQDVFRYVDVDLTNVNGNFTIFRNEEKAGFDTMIQNGDRLAIIWSEVSV